MRVQSKMRVAKLVAPNTIQIFDEAFEAKPGCGEVVVQVKTVGICGTDMHIFRGERADVALPRIMGHELSGVVTAVGCHVDNVKVGDRVIFDPVMACGQCPVCKKGRANVCASVKCFGVQMDGGFQDYITVPAAQVYIIPDKISFDEAALAEPFSIAANILTRAGVEAGENVVIIGSGTIGLCIVQAAKGLGARVLVSDVVDGKLATAKSFGADAVVNSKNEKLEDAVAAFAPAGADVIIDAVGITPLLQQAINMAAPTCRVICISFDGRPATFLPVDVTKKELSIIGSRMNAGQFPRVIEWLDKDMIQPASMISRIFPAEQIQEAFELAVSDGSLMKILIKFGE